MIPSEKAPQSFDLEKFDFDYSPESTPFLTLSVNHDVQYSSDELRQPLQLLFSDELIPVTLFNHNGQIFINYMGKSRALNKGTQLIIGRNPSTPPTLVIKHPNVSRKHAQIEVTPDGKIRIVNISKKNQISLLRLKPRESDFTTYESNQNPDYLEGLEQAKKNYTSRAQISPDTIDNRVDKQKISSGEYENLSFPDMRSRSDWIALVNSLNDFKLENGQGTVVKGTFVAIFPNPQQPQGKLIASIDQKQPGYIYDAVTNEQIYSQRNTALYPGIKHALLNNSQPVDFAGEFTLGVTKDHEGNISFKLIGMNDKSGNYKPRIYHSKREALVKLFKRSGLEIYDYPIHNLSQKDIAVAYKEIRESF